MKILLLIMALVMPTGCSYLSAISPSAAISYAIDSSVLVSSLIKMDETVIAARSSIIDNKAKFDSNEWARLSLAGDQIDELRLRFDNIFGKDVGIKTRIVSGIKLKSIVKDVFTTYDDVEAIVLLHAESFEGEQRLQVLRAKRTMDELKESYNRIRNTAKYDKPTDPIDATDTIQRAIIALQKIAAVFRK